ncbi:hypothetical protein WUBG_15752 [Wuchereria bancrofti]|uniref:Uncharacterized protein n=1 Tax=Wuchereria bancrofti TaxID=6293 RepID=J9E8N2_WUCBA|nr:hypothetical protein WUBG_15752 [Wuchereria bancrofti]
MGGVGSIAYLACHAYHDLHGNNVTKCGIDGIWRPKLGYFFISFQLLNSTHR